MYHVFGSHAYGNFHTMPYYLINMKVSFTVEGEPVQKARPRIVRKGGKTWSYNPMKVMKWSQETFQ
jgi:hypothetical protein